MAGNDRQLPVSCPELANNRLSLWWHTVGSVSYGQFTARVQVSVSNEALSRTVRRRQLGVNSRNSRTRKEACLEVESLEKFASRIEKSRKYENMETKMVPNHSFFTRNYPTTHMDCLYSFTITCDSDDNIVSSNYHILLSVRIVKQQHFSKFQKSGRFLEKLAFRDRDSREINFRDYVGALVIVECQCHCVFCSWVVGIYCRAPLKAICKIETQEHDIRQLLSV